MLFVSYYNVVRARLLYGGRLISVQSQAARCLLSYLKLYGSESGRVAFWAGFVFHCNGEGESVRKNYVKIVYGFFLFPEERFFFFYRKIHSEKPFSRFLFSE